VTNIFFGVGFGEGFALGLSVATDVLAGFGRGVAVADGSAMSLGKVDGG
jgi:hypothetical protein